MNDFTLEQIMGLTFTPLRAAVRRLFINMALRDCKYALDHIAATRANDNLVERRLHKRQAFLTAELRRLGGAK